MIVSCVNVNYFSQGVSDGQGGVDQVPGATVTFDYVEGDEDGLEIDSFTLTFSGLTESLDYFPGGQYELSLTPAVQE